MKQVALAGFGALSKSTIYIEKTEFGKKYIEPIACEQFSDLSIGIQLFNRTEYFERQIEYICKYFDGAQIIVLDGSNNENHRINKNTFDRVIERNNYNFAEYERVPETTNTIKHAEILVRRAARPFYIRWDDDDFYNYLAVKEGIDILRSFKVVSCVFGPSLQFFDEGEKVRLIPMNQVKLANANIEENISVSALTTQFLWAYLVRTEIAV